MPTDGDKEGSNGHVPVAVAETESQSPEESVTISDIELGDESRGSSAAKLTIR